MDLKKIALETAKNEAKKAVVDKAVKGVIGDPHPPQRSLGSKLSNVKTKLVVAVGAIAGLIAAVAELM